MRDDRQQTPVGNGECWAVIPAGGSGSRFSPSEDKLLAALAGVPVLLRTVKALAAVPEIKGVVIAVSPERQTIYQDLLGPDALENPAKFIRFAPGGRDRRESVYNGLLALPESATTVAIHDAARPLIEIAPVQHALGAVLAGAVGAVVAIPVNDTVKQAGPEAGALSADAVIDRTLDRTLLWRAQTPQVFRKDSILAAHRAVPLETPVTDDAQLMELAGVGPMVLIAGSERNLKITTRTDLALAEAVLRMQMA